MDRTNHKILAVQSGTTAGGMDFEIEYLIEYSYLPGAPPILNPIDNADPGWAPEISFVSIDADCDEHGVFKDLALKDLVAWAEDWLSEHYDECIDNAEADRQPDPDDARDRMIEDRERDRGE
jgi:hypothetical protein